MKKYLFLAPFEYTIGNAAEFVYNGAIVAKMRGKKVVLVVRQPGVFRKIVKPFMHLKEITNKEIFNVCSDDPVIIPANSRLPRMLGIILATKLWG